MSIWKTLILSPAVLGCVLLLTKGAQAAEVQVGSTPEASPTGMVVAQNQPAVSQLSQAPADQNALAQVTSVSQLSDVQPTDWAFQALQSLVERYGCIAGYPDGTYRGNRSLTRYEFAAGVNACLDRINELIAAATADTVRREDLATLQRLQEEFSAELATLRGRVDSLEAQAAELEANQFSTTTKLNGEVIFALADVFGDTAAGGGELEVNTILADRARLNFDTSFTGKDLLRTRLQARNITPFNTANTGTNMTRLGFDGNEGNDVEIDDFFYRFPLGNAALVQIDFSNVEFNDNVYTFNPAFDSSGRGAISRFGRFNPIYRQGDEGAGATVTFNPEGKFNVSVGYLAPTANDPTEGLGLFDGSYAALGQVAFRPSDNFDIGFTYARTYENQESGVNLFGNTGSALANQPFGNIATSANHYGLQASVRAGRTLSLAGWAGYSTAQAEAGPNEGDNAKMFNWAASLALQDFGVEGSQLGIIFGQPPKVTDNDGVLGEDPDTSYHLEGLYRLQLTDNIAITPGVMVIFNPEHNNDNDTIYVGTVRTTFSF